MSLGDGTVCGQPNVNFNVYVQENASSIYNASGKWTAGQYFVASADAFALKAGKTRE